MTRQFLIIALLAVNGYPALAESGHGETDYIVQTLRKAQGMLRQTMEEKLKLETVVMDLEARLATQKTEYEGELKTIKQALAGKVQEYDKLLAVLEEQRRVNEAATGQLRAESARLEQEKQGLQERLATLETEFKKAARQIDQRDHQLQRARENQKAIIEVTTQMLADFENKGFWASFTENEPLTGIGHVDKENRIDEFRYRLRELNESSGNDPHDPR